jgi:very-short-patch-repair endonuclease
MGWPDVMVAVEYDGEQHRLDRDIYGGDVIRSEYITQVGWRRVRVLAGHRKYDILRRVHQAWR